MIVPSKDTAVAIALIKKLKTLAAVPLPVVMLTINSLNRLDRLSKCSLNVMKALAPVLAAGAKAVFKAFATATIRYPIDFTVIKAADTILTNDFNNAIIAGYSLTESVASSVLFAASSDASAFLL